MKTNEFKATVIVEHFYSHQGQSNFGQGRRFVSKEYRAYQKELVNQLHDVPQFKDTPLCVDMVFHIKGGVEPETFAVIQNHNDYTVRVCNSIDEALQEIANRQKSENFYRVEKRPTVIKYGVVGDRDNISKPIYDAMEQAGIFENDNIICDGVITKKFGSKENKLEITFKTMNESEVISDEIRTTT